jgi:hypothetical protein
MIWKGRRELWREVGCALSSLSMDSLFSLYLSFDNALSLLYLQLARPTTRRSLVTSTPS